jgi:hypothetical protein
VVCVRTDDELDELDELWDGVAELVVAVSSLCCCEELAVVVDDLGELDTADEAELPPAIAATSASEAATLAPAATMRPRRALVRRRGRRGDRASIGVSFEDGLQYQSRVRGDAETGLNRV